MFPRPVGCRRGATAGPWHRPQWTTPVDSHTLAPVQADRARQQEQARSVLRQARAASAEEAVSSLPPEVHPARRPHEPDMSRVPENRENRLMRPGPPRNPMRETAAPRKTSRPNVFSPTDYSGVVATDLRPSSDCRVSVRHSRQTRDFRGPAIAATLMSGIVVALWAAWRVPAVPVVEFVSSRKQLLQGGPPPMSGITPLNGAPSNWCVRITNRARRGSGQGRFVLCPKR